jgi:hypothetical protein
MMMGDTVSDEVRSLKCPLSQLTAQITQDLMLKKYNYPRALNIFATWMIVVNPLTKFGLCTRPVRIAPLYPHCSLTYRPAQHHSGDYSRNHTRSSDRSRHVRNHHRPSSRRYASESHQGIVLSGERRLCRRFRLVLQVWRRHHYARYFASRSRW